MRELRAMRRIKPEPVREEMIRRVVEYATFAPSQSNSQMWKFLAVTDPGIRCEIGRYYHDAVDWYFQNFNVAPLTH